MNTRAKATASETHVLAVALSRMVPDDITFASGPISAAQKPLFDTEAAVIDKAVNARHAEFTAGRTYARAALRRLGCAAQPILCAADRRPIWPSGYVGAISHSPSHCVCVVASDAAYQSLGVDIEPGKALDPDLYAIVGCAAEQMKFGASLGAQDVAADHGMLVFSIKEVVFKTCYPVTERWIDFLDVFVEIDEEAGSFIAVSTTATPLLPKTEVVSGSWAVLNDHILSVAAVAQNGKSVQTGMRGR